MWEQSTRHTDNQCGLPGSEKNESGKRKEDFLMAFPEWQGEKGTLNWSGIPMGAGGKKRIHNGKKKIGLSFAKKGGGKRFWFKGL